MRDKITGALMFILSVLAMIGYFLWVFHPYSQDFLILGKPLSEWALIVPILIIVYAFLFIIAWIGWTMVSTPPPLPVIPKEPEEKEEMETEE